MIKKIFFTLLIILASSNVSFAKSVDEVDSKNNNKIDEKNLNEAKSEPHFDLPKKDAKEQCEEVERVIKECNNISKDGKINKCGNIYVRSFYFYPLEELSRGGFEPYLIIDQFGNYIASNINDKMILALKHKDNKIFETKNSDLKKSDKKNVTIFHNEYCNFLQINSYYQ
jgi:hypothetical protein